MVNVQSRFSPDRWDHGVLAKYTHGCRCPLCRAANAAYTKHRKQEAAAGRTNRLVSSAAVKAHILKLSKAGVGHRVISDISGVPAYAIHQLRTGKRTQLREQTEARILAVTADAIEDRQHIDARPTRKLLRKLKSAGYSHQEVAERIGASRGLVRSTRVHAITAHRIAKLWREVQEQAAALGE